MSALPAWEPYPLTVEQVLTLVEAGLLDDAHVELLDGVLTPMSPQGPEHGWLIANLRRRISRLLQGEHEISEEKPIITGGTSMPEPDLALTRRPRRRDRHPRGDECVLVIEISVSSQKADRLKAGTYARGGVPEYWMLDVPARELTVWRGPREDGTWKERRVHAEDERIAVPGTDAELTVAELLAD